MGKMTAKVLEVSKEVTPDSDPDTSWLEQAGWEGRLAAYRRGRFGFVGVRATAKVSWRYKGQGWAAIGDIATPGLWGIEDDCGEEYLEEVYQEELRVLKHMLEALGLSLPGGKWHEQVQNRRSS